MSTSADQLRNVPLTQRALLCAFLLLLGIQVLGSVVANTPLAYVGYLLTPGIWFAYELVEVDDHDLLPFVMAELANLLLYWILFIPLVALWRMFRRGRAARTGQA